MIDKKVHRRLAMRSLTSAIFLAAGVNAYAHTTMESQVTEGQTTYNSIQVGHGCTVNEGQPNEKKIPVVAEVVVFPTDDTNAELTDDQGHAFTPALQLSDVIADANGLLNKVSLVQNKDVFAKQDVIYDPDGRTVTSFGSTVPAAIGFYGKTGKLQTNLRARIPFRFSAPTFKAGATDSCVDTLLVQVAIADVCKVSTRPVNGQLNLWVPHKTTVFSDDTVDGVVDSEHGLSGTPYTGAPATLTIKRTTELGASCNGTGKTAILWPTSAWIDKTVNIPRYWKPKAP
jgi:hypothetical protein